MNGEGCWSTVVCTPQERAALGLTGRSEWLSSCRLSSGHRGNHATDASPHPRHDRRLWLEWNDFDDHAQSLIERNPCTTRSRHGAHCVYFEGHGGAHFFAPSNGHTPTHRGMATGQARSAAVSTDHTGSRPNPRRDPVGPPGHADRLRATTDSDIPAVRPSARMHRGGPVAAAGADAVADAGADVAEGAGHAVYRGGRRSTNAEPPAGHQSRVSRHLLPERDGGEPAAVASARPEPPSAEDERLALADALSEVAAALEKLVAALRR